MFNSLATRFLVNLAKDKPIYFFASLVLSLCSAILTLFGTILLIPIFVMIFGNSREMFFWTYPPILRHFLAACCSFEGDRQLIILIAMIALAFICQSLTNYARQIVEIKQSKYLASKLKIQGIELLTQVAFDYYRQNKIEDILFKLNREVYKTVLVITSIHKILISLVNIFFLVVILLLISSPLILVTAILIGLVICGNYFLVVQRKKFGSVLLYHAQSHTRQLIDFLTEIYQLEVISNETKEYREIIRSIEERNQAEFNTQIISALITPVNEISKILIVLSLVIASYYLYNQQLQEFVPVVLIYTIILFRLLPTINILNYARLQFVNNQASLEVVANFFNKANRSIIKSGKIIFTKLETNIEFKNVTFAYPHQAQIVLDKINLHIFPGETLAIVGSIGSGKTTLSNLIARLYDPIEGRVLINGKDLKEYDLNSLRRSISIINRETFLFNTSIKNNLTYGLQNISEREIIAATQKTKADEFITRLPQGLDTKISDKNQLGLSEGHKQLIAITRAFLSNPEIIILDAPTASLNRAERKLVQEALEQLCRDRTTIVITNRLSIIQKADRIIILDKGKIIESGTHQELLINGNLYKRIYAGQLKTSQQFRQQKLAQKIAQKLARQTNSNLSDEIRHNLNSLLDYLQLVNEGLIKDDREQERILDESYQSAKNMLASLKEYQRKISRGLRKND